VHPILADIRGGVRHGERWARARNGGDLKHGERLRLVEEVMVRFAEEGDLGFLVRDVTDADDWEEADERERDRIFEYECDRIFNDTVGYLERRHKRRQRLRRAA
jgi:hypothetical protein